ncbi:MAG: Renal dipeptidase [Parcubacteria group bacterium GW2011_GWA1_40_21]|nr:MAG: Renal dipeptidase [Parcubacteria group bacterium GW2011_GWA1_40_21]
MIKKTKKIFLADALGFFGKRGGPIVVEDGLRLNLVHLTAVPTWITTMEETLREIEKFKKMILDQPKLRLVTNQKELSSAVAAGWVAVVLGMQNTPVDILNKGAIPALRRAGISIISPCYDKQNDMGSGWLNADIKMTRWGKIFLKECAKNNFVIDLFHAGHGMARDIASYIASHNRSMPPFKVMVSHTGCYSQYHHFRNLPDDVLKAVVKLGGVVGIPTLTFTNHETDNSIFSFKDHLNRALQICGADSVCVGSDGLYITRDEKQARKEFEIMSEKLDPLGTQGARFPENPVSIMGPDMLEKLYKFCLPYFPVGVSEKIFGENLLNFFRKALPS